MRKEDVDGPWIERRIITGMIVSTDYLKEIRPLWNQRLLESETAGILADWCLTHFDEYKVAPGKDIENIYNAHLKNGLSKERAESIELVLRGLSDEYERKQFNVPYLVDQSRSYFQERHLTLYAEDIRNELRAGNVSEAEKLASGYHPIANQITKAIDPFSDSEKIRQAFQEAQKPLIRFSKTLGRFWNEQMVRDAFVALMGPEKRGKTFWLIELAMRGMACGCNIAFFQAGDMSELQMIKRLCVYLAKRSDKARYCEDVFYPLLDCANNQLGLCRRKERESYQSAPFDMNDVSLDKITFQQLVEAYDKNKDHQPCHNCHNNRGVVWLVKRKPVEPLNWKDAWRKIQEWRTKHRKQFRLVTYPNETLTVAEIKTLLDTWEREDGFVPDIIAIDYADILAPDPDCSRLDYRNQQNKIWQRLRRLSQQKHCLLLTATQAAATSYEHDTLRLSDFSETKTKYAHVTAMYGLNQTDREKQIGIMRINELVVREGEFDRENQVKVLQRLQTGRPYLGSFK